MSYQKAKIIQTVQLFGFQIPVIFFPSIRPLFIIIIVLSLFVLSIIRGTTLQTGNVSKFLYFI